MKLCCNTNASSSHLDPYAALVRRLVRFLASQLVAIETPLTGSWMHNDSLVQRSVCRVTD